jgi:hypothetical protein
MLVFSSASGAQEVIGQAKRKKILLATMGGEIFTRTQTKWKAHRRTTMTNSNPNTVKANRKAVEQSILEMVDELTENEFHELEDFIVNECDNASFTDENGDFPNLFRIFVTGRHPNIV